eukprot:XP_001695135.1 predicted protein [Chlamydomonas reinhardtii]
MRKHDVPGPNGCISRISAVYDCVERELLAPQLQLGPAMTLIEMQDTAHTCFSRQPFSASLLALVKQHAAYARARSHGNYLPALRAVAREAATIDTSRTRLFLVFLSDGAPSDHTSTRGMTPVDVSNACIQAVEQLGAAAGGRDPSTISSSLSSLLTDLGTSGGGGKGATVRPAVVPTTVRLDYNEKVWIRAVDGWVFYPHTAVVSRVRYNAAGQQLTLAQATAQRGLAVRRQKFGEGAERAVFQATVVVVSGSSAYTVGPRLVAKQPRFLEQLTGAMRFQQETFCRVQAEAEALAQKFNRQPAVREAAWQQVAFLQVVVWRVLDTEGVRGTGSRVVDMLVEELEGQLIKWNNNNGGVARSMGGITEGGGGSRAAPDPAMATGGTKPVYNLQGTWTEADGFTLTDPVIHHARGHKLNGATDEGLEGVRSFFRTHTCNALCRRLGLRAAIV